MIGLVLITLIGTLSVFLFGWLTEGFRREDFSWKGIALLLFLFLIFFLGMYSGRESMTSHPERPPASSDEWLLR